jgi:hypothetical protein|tara:strand:+ start:182 stop:790 length:609 start_codon:yes stop_codon:yes gene_type:complete
LDINSQSEIFLRIKRLFHFKTLITITIGVLLIALPQILYWNYASGSFLDYSYGDEGFNWMNFKLLNTWFSPNNGLFIYTPFYLLVIVLLLLMIKNKKENGIYLLVLFLTISYTFSSWWAWSFGCSFGARSYVEYLSVFSIPIAYLFFKTKKLNAIKIASLVTLVIVLILFNLKMIYSYDDCFYGKNAWDWSWYIELVTSPTK